MLGTIVNSLAIIGGCIVGLLLKGGIPERINEIIMKGISLCVLLIGIQGAIKSSNTLLLIFSMVIGGFIGELIDIDKGLIKLGEFIEKKLKGKGGKVAEGFITASLVYCVGAMAIVGSLESGLTGNHQTLFSKSVLDGISAIIFTSSLGIGVVLSAVSVFIYQGSITMAATLIKPLLTTSVINEMSAIGSLVIVGLSLNLMGITKIKIANLLPAIFIPIFYQIILNIL